MGIVPAFIFVLGACADETEQAGENGFPAAPLILALILGDIMEESMRQALQISNGNWMVFLTSPISLTMLVIAALSLLSPVFILAFKKIRQRRDKTMGM